MARETHELWSWNQRNGAWLAVAQGSERDMKDAAQRRYGSSRKFEMWGSAFTVTRIGDGPHETPDALGVEVLAAPVKTPATPADHLAHLRHMANVRPGRDGETSVWALAEIESLRATVDRVRQAANATFTDPMVAPASAATAERILRALEGREVPA